MRFEILKAKDGQFYFNIVARNHEIVATSELYTTKQSALKTIQSIFDDFSSYERTENDELDLRLLEVVIDKTIGGV